MTSILQVYPSAPFPPSNRHCGQKEESNKPPHFVLLFPTSIFCSTFKLKQISLVTITSHSRCSIQSYFCLFTVNIFNIHSTFLSNFLEIQSYLFFYQPRTTCSCCSSNQVFSYCLFDIARLLLHIQTEGDG